MLKEEFRIKGQKGFGDSICLSPIVSYLLSKKINPIIYTDHPFVFEKFKIQTLNYNHNQQNINASYLDSKHNKNTNQFQDICNNLKLNFKNIEFKFDDNKPCLSNYVYVRMPYQPLSGIKSKFEEINELLPNQSAYKKIVEKYENKYEIIQFGMRTDAPLNFIKKKVFIDEINYQKLLQFLSKADILITQVGHMMHLGELLQKETIVIFSKKGLMSKNEFINTITPRKVLFTKFSTPIIDEDVI